MNHRNSLRKLGKTPAHRRSLLRGLATALVLNDRIETTLPKAKELRRVADGLVTLGKKNTLHARRQAMSYLFTINREEKRNAHKLSAMHKLFEEIAPRYVDRNGGYTRVIRSRRRAGDNAQMAVIEFVEEQVASKHDQRKRRRVVRESVSEAVADAPVTESSSVVSSSADSQHGIDSEGQA